MATVIRTGPYTYVPNEDGSIVPFEEQGVCDQTNQLVTAYEDTSGAFLGSALSSSTPNSSGPYIGWYPYSITITAWSVTAGLVVSGAQASCTAGSTAFSASVPITGAQATGSTGSITLHEESAILNVTGATALGTTSRISLTASRPVSGATSTSATGSITIEWDQTAPTVSSFTVPDTTGTSITGISAAATDAVGVTGWLIIEQAADSGWPTPGTGAAAAANCSNTAGISGGSLSSSALTFTSSATETGTRYFRIYCRDAAGNVGASATDSATITIQASYSNGWAEGAADYGRRFWLRWRSTVPHAGYCIRNNHGFDEETEYCYLELIYFNGSYESVIWSANLSATNPSPLYIRAQVVDTAFSVGYSETSLAAARSAVTQVATHSAQSDGGTANDPTSPVTSYASGTL